MLNFLRKSKNNKGQSFIEFSLIVPLMLFLVVSFFDLFHIVATTVDVTASMKHFIAKAASEGNFQTNAQEVCADMSGKHKDFGPIFKTDLSAQQMTSSSRSSSTQGYIYWHKGSLIVDGDVIKVNGGLKTTTTTGANKQQITQNQLGEQICFAADIPIHLLVKGIFAQNDIYHVRKTVCALAESTNLNH